MLGRIESHGKRGLHKSVEVAHLRSIISQKALQVIEAWLHLLLPRRLQLNRVARRFHLGLVALVARVLLGHLSRERLLHVLYRLLLHLHHVLLLVLPDLLVVGKLLALVEVIIDFIGQAAVARSLWTFAVEAIGLILHEVLRLLLWAECLLLGGVVVHEGARRTCDELLL